jgi:subtilisin family serine protease
MTDVQVARSRPWQPEASRLAVRGRLVLRLRPGEDPEAIPAHRDVLHGHAAAAPRVDGGPIDQVLARFSDRVRVARVFSAAQGLTRRGQRHLGFDDVEHDLGLSRAFRLDVDPDTSIVQLVQELGARAVVESASPHYLCEAPFSAGPAQPSAQPTAVDYARAMIGAAEALSLEPGDESVIVAVIDSGVRARHPELAGRLRPGLDTVDLPKDQVSRGLDLFGDTTGRDRDPDDEVGHGTACAAILAACGRDLPPGLAGRSRVLPIRALAGAMLAERTTPTAVGGLPDIDEGVKAAVDLGARVLNLSFGTPESALRDDDPVPHVEAIRYALARGCILIAASGNSGDRVRYFPAALPGVIAVGAVVEQRAPCRFTTRGDHVALCAPGANIRSAGLDGYSLQNGTSFAAPFVAAACALLLARGLRASTLLGAPTIRELLTASARPFPSGDAHGCGAGILDLPAALRAADQRLNSDWGA